MPSTTYAGYPKKAYIGDSVYAEIDECARLVLTTENGMGPSNQIVVEPEVWSALIEYCRRNWTYESQRHHLEAKSLMHTSP